MMHRVLILIFGLIYTLPVQAVFTDDDVTRQIAELRQRAIQAADTAQPDTLYMQAKADAWLDFAFEEHIERDTTGVAEDALLRAAQLVNWLEAKQAEGQPIPEPIRGTAVLEEELWFAISKLRHDPAGFPCAARYVGRAEVQLIWGRHEHPELGFRHARHYIAESEQFLKEGNRLAENCLQAKVAPPVQAEPVVALVAPPVAPPVEPVPAIAQLPDAVHFAFDSDTLSSESDQVLQLVAKTMQDFPWLKLELGGHTDKRGNHKYNQKLSQRRVDSVYKRMIELGLSSERFISSAHGKSRLLTGKDDSLSRSLDRRVELIITNPQDAEEVKVNSEEQKGDLQQ